MRGSSVNFKKITSALHAVSHASREVPPDYLLPENMSQGTHVVIDDHGAVQKTLTEKMALASHQARASKDFSPLWEGVINLPDPSDATPEQQIEIVEQWCFEYEKLTGHKILRADVHLDEGYVDSDGAVKFNTHAHVMCDRTDEKGRVKKLSPKQLREVQTMTAKVTNLQRGVDARTTGRKHIGHQNFKWLAEKNRLDLDGEKSKAKNEIGRVRALGLQLSKEDAAKLTTAQAEATQLQTQIAQLNAEYAAGRATLKASGEASQQEYQQLKKKHEAALAGLATSQTEAAKVPDLEKKLKAQVTVNGNLLLNEGAAHKRHLSEIERLKAEYAADRAALKASGEAKQAGYQQLKKNHEWALATAKTALDAKTTELTAVQQIADLAAQKEADKVLRLEAQVSTQSTEIERINTEYDTLHAQALRIQTQRDSARVSLATAAERVETMTQENTTLTTQNAQLQDQLDVKTEADRVRFAAMAPAYQEHKAQGKDPALFVPDTEAQHHARMTQPLLDKAATIRAQVASGEKSDTLLVTAVGHELAASKITRIAAEAVAEPSKPAESPTSPTLEKPLVERLAASLEAFVQWVKGQSGEVADIDTQKSMFVGSIRQIDDLHAVQHVGRRTYAIHQIQNLDGVPALGDSSVWVTYKAGVGKVKGRGVGKGGIGD